MKTKPSHNNISSTPKIHLFAFLDIINCVLEIERYPNQNNRWSASIRNSEIKHGPILSGAYGTGKTPEQAIEDYVNKIRNQHIVINAMSREYRREYYIPSDIYFD